MRETDIGQGGAGTREVSKKFKGKRCVYCGVAQTTSADHVFAREFFLPTQRNDLPKVPACLSCNGAKSKVEHYLTTVLPFGGVTEQGAELLWQTEKRLAKNEALRRNLRQDQGTIWQVGPTLTLPSMTIPIDPEQLNTLFTLIAKGLIWHHYRTILSADDFIDVITPTVVGEQFVDHLLSLNGNHAQADLGSGTVRYRGLQSRDTPSITAWSIWFYGGIHFAGQEGALTRRIDVVTGPQTVKVRAERAAAFTPHLQLVKRFTK